MRAGRGWTVRTFALAAAAFAGEVLAQTARENGAADDRGRRVDERGEAPPGLPRNPNATPGNPERMVGSRGPFHDGIDAVIHDGPRPPGLIPDRE